MQNIKNLVTIGRISAVIGVAALAGCSSMMPKSSNDQRSEGRVKDDKNITAAVEKKLKSDPVYKFEAVDVKTYGGVVQLSGFVDSQDQSRRAEELTRSVGGISRLMNGLVLKPQAAAATTTTMTPTGQSSGERLAPSAATSSTSTNSSAQHY